MLTSVQKTAEFKGRFTLLEDRWPLSFSFLFYLLYSSSDHAIPPLCHTFCLLSTITSAWQVTGLHGQDRDLWERKVQVSFGQSEFCQLTTCPEAIHSPDVDWLAKYRAAKYINLSTAIVLLPLRAPLLEVQHSTLSDKEWNEIIIKLGFWFTSLSRAWATRDDSALYSSEMIPIQASMCKVFL